MTITSPNNASRVVWASRWVFFLLSLSFFLLNDVNRSTDALKLRRGSLGRATTTTTGPNDASRVVWALGEFFSFSSCFFLVFNDLHRYYRFSKGTVWFNTSNDDDNGPKRCETLRLGPRWVLFNLFLSFIYYLTIYLGDPGHSETTGPKRRLHRRLGPGIITIPYAESPTRHHTTTPPHLDGSAMRGNDKARDEQREGLETRLEPRCVCFFFVYLIVLTINIISSF